jgi:FkbM family methyltransferase
MSTASTGKPAPYKLKRYYHWGEDKPPIHYRDKTSDMDMINSILIKQQEYFFPNNFEPDLIYDIGANIGVVAVILANIYPKAIIHAFEPQKTNFEILYKNCTPYQNIHLHAVGLGASSGSKKLWPSDSPTNFGGFSNFIQSGEPEDCKILSVARTVEQYGVPDLIKIDCEGAECEILRNFPKLDLVSWITGELHGVDAEYLLLHRLDSHFRLAIQRNFFDKVWHFHAVNKGWTDFGRDTTHPAGENGLEATAKNDQTGGSTTT